MCNSVGRLNLGVAILIEATKPQTLNFKKTNVCSSFYRESLDVHRQKNNLPFKKTLVGSGVGLRTTIISFHRDQLGAEV